MLSSLVLRRNDIDGKMVTTARQPSRGSRSVPRPQPSIPLSLSQSVSPDPNEMRSTTRARARGNGVRGGESPAVVAPEDGLTDGRGRGRTMGKSHRRRKERDRPTDRPSHSSSFPPPYDGGRTRAGERGPRCSLLPLLPPLRSARSRTDATRETQSCARFEFPEAERCEFTSTTAIFPRVSAAGNRC